MAIKTASYLAAKCVEVAQNYKTLYVMGCFGSPMNAANKERYTANHSYNRQTTRTVMIKSATSDTFGFDCVCLIKGLLWGWSGNTVKTYGGASYGSNGVPDISADQMINVCKDVSTNFSGLEVGEILWTTQHVGIYIGNGLAVECTPQWKNGVQITAVLNIGAKSGYNGRTWKKHGKLPYVTYDGKGVLIGVKEEKTETTAKPADPGYMVSVKLPLLQKGSTGGYVKTLQRQLIAMGYEMKTGAISYGADGSFGGATEKALIKMQGDYDLETDGQCGPATWPVILRGGNSRLT